MTVIIESKSKHPLGRIPKMLVKSTAVPYIFESLP